MIRFRSLCFALASMIAVIGGIGLRADAASAGDDKVKLSGCLIRGEGNGGYLLINTPSEPSSAGATTPIAPGAVGTSGTFANVFYWLGDHADLRDHVGHRVEIEGEQKGDIKDGEMKIDRKDQWTEMEIKSDGKSIKARVPNSSVVAGPNPDKKLSVLVRKVDVGHVRMLGASCS
jgi:hypothetical protein